MSFDFLNTFAGSYKTAGALPSTRTESMTQETIDGGDFERLKVEAQHLRAHYESLEFAVSAVDINVAAMQQILGAEQFDDLDKTDPNVVLEFAARFFASEVSPFAYQQAHQSMMFMSLGFSTGDAVRAVYPNLDHTDPEKDAVEAVAIDLDDDDQ